MSGFTKSAKPVAGTSSSIFVPSGIPTLDALLKIQPETITAIYEDESSYVHNTMLQVFTSESIAQSGLSTHVLGMEPKYFFYYSKRRDATDAADARQKFTIAWRYSSLGAADDPFEWNLASRINLDPEHIVDSLAVMLEALKKEKQSTFVIYSLFAPLYPKVTQEEMLKILFDVRKYTRLNHHAVLLSVPAFLLNVDPSPFFDNIVEVTSILAMPNEKVRSHGLLTLKKTSLLGALEVRNWDGVKYSINVSSKTFSIKKIDIPPEENAPSAGPACAQQF